MSETRALPTTLCQRILSRFSLPAQPPLTPHTLQSLVKAYTRAVPWESASRIVRRARYADPAECILLGAEFWESHFEAGTGGTCYESNYAFFGLLRRLGFEGYLTINDMGAAVGCHSAIVVTLAGQKYLVDVGYPLHAVPPLCDDGATTAENAIMDYTVEPLGESRYAIWRELEPRGSAFQLNDSAVSAADYRAIGIHDYRHNGGQFLNEVVIHKVVDDQLWRFNSGEKPWRLQQFVHGERRDHTLGDDPAAELARKFGIARAVVAEALAVLGITPGGRTTK